MFQYLTGHFIKWTYGCQGAIRELWDPFVQPVRRNIFFNERTLNTFPKCEVSTLGKTGGQRNLFSINFDTKQTIIIVKKSFLIKYTSTWNIKSFKVEASSSEFSKILWTNLSISVGNHPILHWVSSLSDKLKKHICLEATYNWTLFTKLRTKAISIVALSYLEKIITGKIICSF